MLLNIFLSKRSSFFRVDEELNKLIVEESDSRQRDERYQHGRIGSLDKEVKKVLKIEESLQSEIDADGDVHGGGIGTISFVSCGNTQAKEAAAEQEATSRDAGGITQEEGKISIS